MKYLPIFLALTLSLGSIYVFGQTPTKSEQGSSTGGTQDPGPWQGMGSGMMGGGYGYGMMHGSSGMGMWPLTPENTSIEVKNIASGVTITIVAKDVKDSKTINRIQKRAQLLKLMHELNE